MIIKFTKQALKFSIILNIFLLVKKMETGFQVNLKEYFWNSIKKFTNRFSYLTVKNIGNGNIPIVSHPF